MEDKLIIATTEDGAIRIYTALTTKVVEEAGRIHETWPTATAAFGRLLTGTLMMGVMSDNIYRLTVTFAGDGPCGRITAVSNQRGVVKGELANPQVDFELNSAGKLDVAKAVGSGELIVLKDFGLKDPYQGIVPIQSGEIAEDLAYYFAKSEQTPSVTALGVIINPDGSVKVAGGFIIQMMPGYTEETIGFLEEKLRNIPAVTQMLSEGITPEQLAEKLTPDQQTLKILDTVNVYYKCDCSRERFISPLLSLDPEEIGTILKEQGRLEVRCHFCNQLYYYEENELNLNSASK